LRSLGLFGNGAGKALGRKFVIQPTIGRRVWYWPSDEDFVKGKRMTQLDGAQALDAGIVYVWSDGRINLSVTDHAGDVHARVGVTLAQDGDPVRVGGYATWMPYQVAQSRPTMPPPVDNAHVAPGCEKFSDPDDGDEPDDGEGFAPGPTGQLGVPRVER
jgi:hypothetical protein